MVKHFPPETIAELRRELSKGMSSSSLQACLRNSTFWLPYAADELLARGEITEAEAVTAKARHKMGI